MKRFLFISMFSLAILICLSGCTKNYGLSASDPTTITLWHNYGGIMQVAMDELVDEFNNTVGKKMV